MGYEEDRKIQEAKNRLTLAFALLRKKGLIARQRFSCCRSCAGYELATYASDAVDKDSRQKDKIKGCVFYTRQSDFVEKYGRSYRACSLYLSFGQLETTKHGGIGLETVEVGKLVCECLKEVGLPFEWDGNPDECILVDPTKLELQGAA